MSVSGFFTVIILGSFTIETLGIDSKRIINGTSVTKYHYNYNASLSKRFADGNYSSSDCIYSVNSQTLDLSSMMGHTIAMTNDYTYYYTPCENGLTCDVHNDGTSYEVMVAQYDQPGLESACLPYIATFDESTQPSYSNIEGTNMFTFTFSNGLQGSCQSNRVFTVNWICDSQYNVFVSSMTENPTCYYTMNILARAAC